jgi:hypothetical protein
MEVESYGEPNNYMKYIMLECNLSSSGHLFTCGSASFIRVPLRIETILACTPYEIIANTPDTH